MARPPGFTSASPEGVSNDGNSVWLSLSNPQTNACIDRFLDRTAGVAEDRPCDSLVLSADGSTGLVTSGYYAIPSPVGDIGGPTQINLVKRSTGEVLASANAGPTRYFAEISMNDTGTGFWAIETEATGSFDGCGGPLGPPCSGQVTAIAAVTATTSGRQRFDVPGNLWGTFEHLTTTGADGRFLVFVTRGSAHSLHVLDRFTHNDEVLVGEGTDPGTGASVPPGHPWITDDGRVLAAAGATSDFEPTGWYEYLP